MVEWSITVVLKTTVPRGTGGSNPSLSAKSSMSKIVGLFFFYATDFGLHSGICRIIVFLSLLSQTKIIEIFGMSLKSIVTLHQRLKKEFNNLEI